MARKTPQNTENPADMVSVTNTAPTAEQMSGASEAAAATYTSACGGAIRMAREKQGMSVNDIANQLRLGIKQVEAIEADDFEKLPHPSIVRGFIRNYAKLLKIDAEPLLAGYYQLAPNAEPQSFRVKSNAGDSHVVIGEPKANFSVATFVGMIACFALIGFVFYYYTQNVKPNEASTAGELNPPAIDSQTGEPATVEFALPPAERQATPVEGVTDPTTTELALPPAVTAPAASPLPNEAAPLSPPAVDTVPSTGNPAPPNTPPTALPSITPNALPPITPTPGINPTSVDGNKKAFILEVNAKEETWINITDANGKRIYSKVVPSGASDSIEATPPVNVVVGNPAGTVLSKNGQPLDLAAYTRSKVARLTLND